MNLERINNILNNDDKCDVFYDNRCIWIQSVDNFNQTAQVGFIDDFKEKNVPIQDLYE